ncbi:transcriptional attenuator, LytR family [Streptomyces sp. TLI_053]|uniref:LCP family protein n=1 Tax=Streptomyces sp. TLI_053 TaxID=1855352 RepID=UPI0008795908|nr:LCP family protein [Streptomyces sp. TLI_053]SDT71493.1 transcriptional attenuator, LytR family [Streptomyces sp. TLI_053]
MSVQWDGSPPDPAGRADGGVRTDDAVRPEDGPGRFPAPRPGGRAEARRAARDRVVPVRPGRGGTTESSRTAARAGRRETPREPRPDARGGSGGSGQRTARSSGRNGRSGARRLIAWSVAGVLVVLAGAGGAVYYKLNGNLRSFDADAISPDRPPESAADAHGHRPVNLLLIGSDSRAGKNSDLGGGDETGARSDTTILLHVYADHRHAVGISIPRDALVTVPRCKLPNGKWTREQPGQMFNSAFSVGNSETGNPACTLNTVERLTGIRVDHTIEVNFEGFAAMTGAVGGVDVCLPNDIHEGNINPNLGRKGKVVLAKGRQRVSGQQALDYVRLRHGIGDDSDVGRMKRQQAFLASLLAKIKSKGLSPGTLLPLADAATRSMTVDPGLDSAAKLVDFALTLKGIDLHEVKFLTTPWRYSGARIDLVHPAVDTLWRTLQADRTIDGQDATGRQEAAGEPTAEPAPTPTPSADPSPAVGADGTPIRVTVYNATNAAGLAARAAETLRAARVTVAGTSSRGTARATTTVEYGTGQRAAAEKVAALFPGAAVAPGQAAGISLRLGRDYAAGGTPSPTATGPAGSPAPLPTEVVSEARSGDDDICSNVSYG